jgi:opacity protein-like surface antigen
MKKILISSVLATVMTLPALAGSDMAPASSKDMKDMKQIPPSNSDAGFYVAVEGGANFHTDYGDKTQTASVFGTTLTTKPEINNGWGGVGGLKAGYNFESFALGDMWGLRLQPAVEAEALYIGENSSASNVFAPGIGEHFSSNSGDFFLNGILRFKNKSIVTPYIGAGVGLQYLTTHGTITTASGPFPSGTLATGVNTSDTDFAGQGLIGFDVQICPHLSLFSEYKFIDAIGTDAKSTNTAFGLTGTYRFKPDQLQQNLVTGGVKYSF